MNFYNFRTTAVNQFNASAPMVKCAIGRKGVTDFINSIKDRKFTTDNWDELKAIERTILSIGKEAEMNLLTQESRYYGKKYIAIAY